MSLLNELNHKYVDLHSEKEEAFWAHKMALSRCKPGDFEAKERNLKEFVTDEGILPRIRTELQRSDLGKEERTALEGWRRFFEVNAVESKEAKGLQDKLVTMEGELDRARRGMKLGYNDGSGKWIDAGSDKMRLVLATSPDEKTRRAAWEGLSSIGPFVLNNGYIEIVKERNRLGRLLGYEDYYDYKVNLFEGFSKKKLFELLGELESNTRVTCLARIEGLEKEQDLAAREPWNFEYLISGALTAQADPFMPFEGALSRWGRSFAAMEVSYQGATLQLDLVNRKGKEENGFMHGPFPGYVDNGKFLPARINFTANALPGQVGAGAKALGTFFHEGGHAAHFANIVMPAPCFSQEFAPTSVAFAETQSMFMDSLVEDPDWRLRYARTMAGQVMPKEIIRESVIKDHRYLAYRLRSMLMVPYAERAIYEMSDSELTPENITKRVLEIEREMVCLTAGVRPVLSVPHLLSGEASAYYHGYVLATMAVYHTRAYFKKKYGFIMDNPDVGKDLTEKYWRPGNSKTFLELVQNLTTEPFSAKATVDEVNEPGDSVLDAAEKAMENEGSIPRYTGPVDLNAHIRMVHGDELIASNDHGENFDEIDAKYSRWLRGLK